MAFPGENIPIAAEVTRAARELVGRSVERPVVLGYHPVARMNPFQELLYLTGPESGVGVVPLIKQADFPVLEAAVKMGVPAVLHLHWTSAIMAPALNEFDAERRARLFITELEDLKALGVRLVWTVHNVLPHHCKYASAEARMRGELAALADGIHIMNPATVEEVAEHYELPVEKTFQIPHPSYAEFYPRIARGDARFALGFEPDDVVIGAIGSIQPYKGLRTLGSAVAEASRSNRRVTGLVAGMPGPDSAHVIEDLARWPSVRTIAKKLSDRELAQA
ncbi:MAG: hypothetical protein U9R47_08835, partial [Actinomycetota bacterium]|nr:hypothetical protein [Actinomycetota bacterium]